MSHASLFDTLAAIVAVHPHPLAASPSPPPPSDLTVAADPTSATDATEQCSTCYESFPASSIPIGTLTPETTIQSGCMLKLACGHTTCYMCLHSLYIGARKRKWSNSARDARSCPICRAPYAELPRPLEHPGGMPIPTDPKALDGFYVPVKKKKKKTATKNPVGVPAKKKKKKKDPNAPKRPKNAYLYYCMEHRPKVKVVMPGLKPTEITTQLGKQWKELSVGDRGPFVEKAAADKVRYLAEVGDYVVGAV